MHSFADNNKSLDRSVRVCAIYACWSLHISETVITWMYFTKNQGWNDIFTLQ